VVSELPERSISLIRVTEPRRSVRRGEIDPTARVHESAQVWDLVQVREFAEIGAESVLGRGVYIGSGAVVGSRCKIQNYAQVFEPAVLEDGVFIGPGVILTNDRFPRAVGVDLRLKSASDWSPVGVHVEFGASIGAGAICVAPVRIGKWAMVAAGAVVTRTLRPFELVAGTPARHVGWVGCAGQRLVETSDGLFRCPVTHQKFQLLESGELRMNDSTV
jgi:UDP-2-acetamido-3-amino-2,3-dideoxy-glucuronate N-acetyltransferase